MFSNKVLYILVFLLPLSLSAQKINWLSFEEATELSYTDPKPFFIFIYTDWCGYCKEMEKKTFVNTGVINSINKYFYAIRLNGEERASIFFNNTTYKNKSKRGNHELAELLLKGEMSFPAMVYLDTKYEVNSVLKGYRESKVTEIYSAYYGTNSFKEMSYYNFYLKYLNQK